MHKRFIEKVDNVCKEYAEKELICYFRDNGIEEKWTYGMFRKEVGSMVEQLEKSTIRKGDRVLLMSAISPEACRMIVALAIFGATCVILDAEQPRDELSYLIKKSDIRAIVTNAVLYNKCVKEYEDEYPVFNIANGCQFDKKTYDLKPTEDPDEEVIAIIYSSGTTSEPKGVMITYEAQLCSSRLLLQAFGTTDIRYLLVFPLFHISGFSTFLAIFLGGGQMGLLENVNSTKLLEGFQKYHPNAFGMVPKIYEAIQQKIVEEIKRKKSNKVISSLIDFSGLLRKVLRINIGKYIFKSINRQVFGGEMIYLGVGGGLVTEDISDFFLKLGYRWMNTYASTEQNLPMATTTSVDNYPLNAVGKINRFSEIDIRIQNRDKNGKGEIQIKSPCHMKGYFRDADATKQAYDGEYFRTGDLGYIDNNGYLYVTGRSKESIHLQNGEKVSPERIESLYASCIPENTIAACVGILSEGKGYDEIVYFIEKNANLNEEHIRHDILEQSQKIGGNFRVSQVLFIDKIPLSTIGKVQRYKLRNMKPEAHTREKSYGEKEELTTFDKLIQIFLKLDVKVDIKPDFILEQDLGLDSLNLFELCVEIENVFHVDVSNCISSKITVSELCQIIETDENNKKSTVGYNIDDYPMHRHKGDKRFLAFMGKLTKICYSFETKGLENIPETGPYIICANHESHLDGMWIVIASEGKINLEQFCCMAKQEHLEHVISRKGLRVMGGIPVDRSGNTSPAMRRAMECLIDEKIVLIHPEGTRTNNGKLGELKAGVEKLALETNVPILPVKITGAYDIFPKNRKLPRIMSRKGKYKLSVQFFPLMQAYDGVTKELSDLLGENKVSFPFPQIRTKLDYSKLSFLIGLSKKIRSYHIKGIDNFKEGENYIICSNHASTFDPIWILAALNKKVNIANVVTLAAIERSKDSKGFFRMLGCIPVNRNYGVHPEINCVESCIKKGMNAIIFPEGARTRDGSLMELKKGVIKIAKDTNTSILPIRIDGGFDIFPRHIKRPRLFKSKKCERFDLYMDIHEPISPRNLSDEEMFEQLKFDLKGEQL